ncbi:MAG: putative cysteine ligase BshC [Planctomycetota bacterium]|nr:bacillithiol biosynthesis cysteine-adding enzyme BshC [Planctomycetota bacterium]GIK51268.1 MAG: putative cysteine ligase BshC [Planctomycetota bacterium]
MRYLGFEQQKLGGGNELGQRYLTDFPRLEPFYAADYRSAQSLASHAIKLHGRTWRSRYDRALTAQLVSAYIEPFNPPPAAQASLKKLADRQSLCVLTGQQAGLGGGPLLTLYKAVTAVRLAAEMEAALALPVVPLFWVASDDSDVEEVNRFRVLQEGRLAKFRFNMAAGKTPVRDLPLPAAFDDQWAKLLALLPEGPKTAEAKDLLTSAAGLDFGTAFSRLLLRLLGPLGLLVVEPKALVQHPAWRRIIAAEIDQREAHRLLLRRAADRFEAQGLSAGVPVTNQLNLFRHVKGERRRISDGGVRLKIDGSESPMTKSALLSALKADPAGFSPSALLRPVIQNAIFPTLAYVGGQAEIAYHGLLKGLHRATQTFMPALFPRISMTLVQSSDMREFADLLAFRGRLQWRQNEAGVLFDTAERGVRASFAALKQDLGALAKPLASEVSRLEVKTLQSLTDVRGRVKREPLAVSKESAPSARLLERYFPEGELQERELTWLGEYARLGDKLVQAVQGLPNIFDFRHHAAEV